MKGQIPVRDMILVVVIGVIAVFSIGLFLCSVAPPCDIAGETDVTGEVKETFVSNSLAEVQLNTYLDAEDEEVEVAELWLLYHTTGDTSYKDRAETVYKDMFQDQGTQLTVGNEVMRTESCTPDVDAPHANRKLPVPGGGALQSGDTNTVPITLGLCG